MSNGDEKLGLPQIEQVSFFPGQQLTADDLAAAQRTLREMRWLHNRTLHGWGIALGLEVHGQVEEAAVTIAPGYALDCRGREIVLTEPVTVDVPTVVGSASAPLSYLLTIAYPDDLTGTPTAWRVGTCAPSDTVRLLLPPVVRWLQPQQEGYRHGLDIILAQAWLRNCRLVRPLSFGQRRDAREKRQPYVASGKTLPGQTMWEPLRHDGILVGFTTIVNTSKAGFRATPAYQAYAAGKHLISVGGDNNKRSIIVGQSSIDHASPTEFQLTLLLPAGLMADGSRNTIL